MEDPDASPASQHDTSQSQAAPQPAGRPRRRRWLPLALAAAALALGFAAACVVRGELPSYILGLREHHDIEKIEVDAQAFREYFTVQKKRLGSRGRTLVVALKRTRNFPQKDSDFETLAEKAAPGLPSLLALETVARGYVRCEYFGDDETFLGFSVERIRGLAKRESVELALPVAGRAGLSRIVFTY